MPEDWNEKAKGVLKSILARKNIKYHELARRLNDIGVEETKNTIANKISRGSFSFAFFLQCMAALEIDNIRIDE